MRKDIGMGKYTKEDQYSCVSIAILSVYTNLLKKAQKDFLVYHLIFLSSYLHLCKFSSW